MITIGQNSITIPAIALPDGTQSAAQTVDLSVYQGQHVRVYMSSSGQIMINPVSHQYLLLAEITIPPAATQQVQVGTKTQNVSSVVQVVRNAIGTPDQVPLLSGQTVGLVGFAWSGYRLGIDYTELSGEITWATTGRQPKVGDKYQVDVLTGTSVPVLEQQSLPLDLSVTPVTIFALPTL